MGVVHKVLRVVKSPEVLVAQRMLFPLSLHTLGLPFLVFWCGFGFTRLLFFGIQLLDVFQIFVDDVPDPAELLQVVTAADIVRAVIGAEGSREGVHAWIQRYHLDPLVTEAS